VWRLALTLSAASIAIAAGGCASSGGDVRGEAGTAAAQTPPVPPPAPPGPKTNSADRVIFWLSCAEVAAFTDRELDTWRRRGVEGFVCESNQLSSLGGRNAFSARPGAPPRGAAYALQRRLTTSRVGERARRRGMSLYLGFFAASTDPAATTPFLPWFDEAGWSRRVLPAVRSLATVAHRLGFAGVAIDQELYAQPNATWAWNHAGNSRSESATRAMARRRGAQLMGALTGGFPGVDVIAYATQLPGSWEEHVQEQVNRRADAFVPRLHTELWDGMAGARGYAAIRFAEAIFYKTPHVGGNDWDAALRENARSLYAMFSREWSSWPRAATRVHVTPFAWIDAGPSEFERARPPAEVARQLAAFRRWGTGGAFLNFAYRRVREFDYRPYLPGLAEASTPAVVDTTAPVITADAPVVDDRGTATLTGTASDDSAIRYLRWNDGRGGRGVAALEPDPADPARVTWKIELRVPPGATTVRIRAEDIKGLATSGEVVVNR
jgi:hypothetical protein